MSALTLTAKETEMLVAVMSEMGEIPNTIDFERVASRVDVKYGKNARQSFKKLFEKLKAQAGPSPDGGDGTRPPKTPSPTKRASPKKKVGANNTPIKATPRPRGKKATVKKEAKEEYVDSDEALEDPVLVDEDGKSPKHISPLTAEKTVENTGVGLSTGLSESIQTSDEDIKMSVVEVGEDVVDEQVELDEQLQADEGFRINSTLSPSPFDLFISDEKMAQLKMDVIRFVRKLVLVLSMER
ncbi:hypothetical protein SBOR_9540 [Sclerotinia borealis F-4128]|uniref:Uncharacterized protein n=1 Tax=Sclerotinia borealis (strain F-4128) TaxID=1432307 RepID=W9C2F6_SCLBF|nr:hypothetical protein SBOR_9540 [Sclerotinia borealis F-4128]